MAFELFVPLTYFLVAGTPVEGGRVIGSIMFAVASLTIAYLLEAKSYYFGSEG